MAELLDQLATVVKNRNDLTKWWRHNANAKHGTPWVEEPDAPVKVQHEHNHTGLDQPKDPPVDTTKLEEQINQVGERLSATIDRAATTSSQRPLPETIKEKLGRYLWPVVLGGGLVGGSSGLTYWLTQPGDNKPDTTEQQPPAEGDKQSQSVLQHIQDEGLHILPGERK